jgi:diacylglycerol kinase (ATP)
MWQHWIDKFRCAGRGLWWGMRGQSSFYVHVPAAALVLCLAWWLECSGWQWCVLGLCIGLVWSLELVNSAIELLTRAICKQHDPEVGMALDVASAAVQAAAIVAAFVGGGLLAYQAVCLFSYD